MVRKVITSSDRFSRPRLACLTRGRLAVFATGAMEATVWALPGGAAWVDCFSSSCLAGAESSYLDSAGGASACCVAFWSVAA
ncbi:MAG: hypothetical protein ACXU9C_25610 [Xanthobacteraceae bacterium]